MNAARHEEVAAAAGTAFRIERLGGVVDAVSEPIVVQDRDGRVVFANAAAIRMSGRGTFEELVAADWPARFDRFEMFDELGRRVDPAELPSRTALQTGHRETLVIRWRDTVGGREGWSSLSAVPLLDDDGRPELAVSVTHDVTDSKLLEDALRVSELRSRLLADATRDLDESLHLDRTIDAALATAVPHLADWATLDLLQPDGSVQRVGVAVADPGKAALGDRLRGYSVEPGAGRAGDRALSERRPIIVSMSAATLLDDPARPGIGEILRGLGTTGAMAIPLLARGTVEGVLFLAAANDSRRYEEADAVYAMELGRRIALAVGNARLYAAEQAARQAAEASVARAEALSADLASQRNRLEAIIRNLPNGVMVVEAPSGRAIVSNEVFDRILGPADPSTKPRRRNIRIFTADGAHLPVSARPLERTIRTGEPVEAQELKVRRQDGTEVWISMQSTPILAPDGRVVAGVAVVEDITARRRQQAFTAFQAEASSILSASLDYEETIAAVAKLVVPKIADWSAVDIVGEDGVLRSLGEFHADSPRLRRLAELRDRLAGRRSESVAARVIRTASPLSVVITEAMIEASLTEMQPISRADANLARSLAGMSMISVPLVIGGRAIGALTIASAAPDRAFGPTGLDFVQEIAARAAAAIQNARLFREASRFRTILDTIRDGVTIVDPVTLRVTYANDAVLEQTGRSRDAMIGHSTPDWTEGLSLTEMREFLAPLLAGEVESLTLDLVRIRGDGSRLPVAIRWQMVELTPTGPQLVAISRDIRDRIQSERRLTELARAEHARAAELNTIIGAIGAGLVVVDDEGRITLANPMARAMLDPLETLTRDAMLARFEDPDGLASGALGVPGATITLRLRAAGAPWIEISTHRVGEESSPGGELIMLLRDVTATREREAIRDAFVGILSHELRTPVTTIYAGAKVLARTESALDPEARRGIFDDIHGEAERLHRLVEDVVAITRFGEGALEIGSEPVLLQRIIPTVVRSEQNRWPDGRFEVRIEGGLPPVSGDPTYVEQVIRNLLANAVKYGRPQTPIQVAARLEADEVQVAVLDEGPGFPEGEADRLFELYYRSPATANHVSGSGIGLYVCARLLDAMGGRIWAANRPAGGAEFGFALRVMPDDEA